MRSRFRSSDHRGACAECDYIQKTFLVRRPCPAHLTSQQHLPTCPPVLPLILAPSSSAPAATLTTRRPPHALFSTPNPFPVSFPHSSRSSSSCSHHHPRLFSRNNNYSRSSRSPSLPSTRCPTKSSTRSLDWSMATMREGFMMSSAIYRLVASFQGSSILLPSTGSTATSPSPIPTHSQRYHLRPEDLLTG